MRFIADNKESVTLFSTLCKKYANYEWAVAWAGEVKGFDLANILSANEDKIRKIVIGLHFYQTAPSFIRRFMSNKQVRFILQSDGTFHSKVYLFYNSSSDWAAIVGSMNFTNSAFHKNSEAGIFISSKDVSGDTFNQIRDYIASVWENGKLMSDDNLSAYIEASKLQQSKLDSLKRLEVLSNKKVVSWILPYNENKFRFMDWLKTHNHVFWRQKVNLNPGDIVYIYGSAPIRAIVCALRVEAIDYPNYLINEEKKYWVSPDSLTVSDKYAKLNVLSIPENREALSYDNLHEHGLKVPPQGGIKLRGELKDYFNSIFEFEKK